MWHASKTRSLREEITAFDISKHRNELLHRQVLNLTVFELSEIGNFLLAYHNGRGGDKFRLPATYALELLYKRAERDGRTLTS